MGHHTPKWLKVAHDSLKQAQECMPLAFQEDLYLSKDGIEGTLLSYAGFGLEP